MRAHPQTTNHRIARYTEARLIMALINQQPIYISVGEFRKLTKMSINSLSELTEIPKRTLYRYQRNEKKGEHHRHIEKYLALIYKSNQIEM